LESLTGLLQTFLCMDWGDMSYYMAQFWLILLKRLFTVVFAFSDILSNQLSAVQNPAYEQLYNFIVNVFLPAVRDIIRVLGG